MNSIEELIQETHASRLVAIDAQIDASTARKIAKLDINSPTYGADYIGAEIDGEVIKLIIKNAM